MKDNLSLQSIDIVVVEDKYDDAILMVMQLENSGFDVNWIQVETAQQLTDHLTPTTDLVLSDHSLPQFSSIKALEVVAAKGFDIPFIVVSGSIGEETAVDLMRAGAADYLLKDRLSRLGEAVRQALSKRDLQRIQRESNMQIAILGRAIESSPSAIVIADTDGTITYANEAFCKMFSTAVTASLSLSLIWEDHIELSEILVALNTLDSEPLRGEIICTTKAGDQIQTIQYSASQVVSIENQIDCLMVNLVDISEQKKSYKLQAALDREQALHQIRNRFTSMLVHDFRNPVASIKLALSTVIHYKSKLTLDQILEKIDRALQNTAQLESLIDDVLMVGKLEDSNISLDLKPVNFVLFCKEGIHSFKSNLVTSNHKIEFISNVSEVVIEIDPIFFARALENLLSNAIKYSGEEASVAVQLSSNGDTVALKIIDQGVGIPEDDLPNIFDGFFRASNANSVRGTGLGLAIVELIIESHDGTISCESQLGKGSTFTIELPSNDANI